MRFATVNFLNVSRTQILTSVPIVVLNKRANTPPMFDEHFGSATWPISEISPFNGEVKTRRPVDTERNFQAP